MTYQPEYPQQYPHHLSIEASLARQEAARQRPPAPSAYTLQEQARALQAQQEARHRAQAAGIARTLAIEAAESLQARGIAPLMRLITNERVLQRRETVGGILGFFTTQKEVDYVERDTTPAWSISKHTHTMGVDKSQRYNKGEYFDTTKTTKQDFGLALDTEGGLVTFQSDLYTIVESDESDAEESTLPSGLYLQGPASDEYLIGRVNLQTPPERQSGLITIHRFLLDIFPDTPNPTRYC